MTSFVRVWAYFSVTNKLSGKNLPETLRLSPVKFYTGHQFLYVPITHKMTVTLVGQYEFMEAEAMDHNMKVLEVEPFCMDSIFPLYFIWRHRSEGFIVHHESAPHMKEMLGIKHQ